MVLFFLKEKFHSTLQMRIYFFSLIVPILIMLIVLMLITSKITGILYFMLNFVAYVSCTNFALFSDLKNDIIDIKQVVYNYAKGFFASSFWFVVLPGPIGVVIYFILTNVSDRLKVNKQDLLIYNLVIDKMLFWLNLLPYMLLSCLFALVGNFEQVFFYAIKNFKYKISAFYLEDFLFELSLLAVDNKKNIIDDYGYQAISHYSYIDQNGVDRITALLYRVTLFFVAIILITTVLYNIALLII